MISENVPLIISQQGPITTLTLNRIKEGNSLNPTLVQALVSALENIQQQKDNRIIVIQGQSGVFCKGMDFDAAINQQEQMDSSTYMSLLRQLATIPRIVIAKVEGIVMAGGMGLVAASDLVVSSPQSQFSLSEALWGLLPCCVAPYLIRRVGFQAAARLTITTEPINAEEAHRIQLVDYLSTSPDDEIRKHTVRLARLDQETVNDFKQYFRKMWLLTDAMEKTAVDEITRLTQAPRIKQNITRFIQEGKLPWDKD